MPKLSRPSSAPTLEPLSRAFVSDTFVSDAFVSNSIVFDALVSYALVFGSILFCLLLFGSLNLEARQVIPFNTDWRFQKESPSGLPEKILSNKDQEIAGDGITITLPHTWNAEDGQSADYYRGVGWYKKTFQAPPLNLKQKIFIHFEAANQEAEVYLNNNLVGSHRGGYTAFTFELTPFLKKEGDNLLVVKVSNQKNLDIPPVTADYTFFGGIYRPVRLLVVEDSHIETLDYGSSGVHIRPLSVSKKRAEVQVETLIAGPTQNLKLRILVLDANKKLIVKTEQPAQAKNLQNISISNPHLWNGLTNPYMYQLVVQLHKPSHGGDSDVAPVIDEVIEPLGLRFFSVDSQRGLIFNGKPYELRGVNIHQDKAQKGWALNDEDRNDNIKLLLEMGANAVRLSHYPHAQGTLDLLDKYGIISWAEIPLINSITASAAFADNARTQLLEMIRQQGNHPSILFWGLFNEVPKDPIDLITSLNNLAHAEDPSRLTTAASNVDLKDPINHITDLLGLNLYFGWYNGKVADLGPALDKNHATQALRRLAVSEYGAGGSVKQHGTKEPVTPGGPFHPEEGQSLFHEIQGTQLADRSYLWGHFIWNMFDFASATRNEGATKGINDKGLVTGDRETRKDAFYFYKAKWKTEPILHLTGQNWTNRPCADLTMKIYSNEPHLELLIDGHSFGDKFPSHGVIFEWQNLNLNLLKSQHEVLIKSPRNHSKTFTFKCLDI